MSTTPPPVEGVEVAAPSQQRWPLWAWMVPWVILWLLELPLLAFDWGFTLSKFGAAGILFPLGLYLGVGLGIALLSALLATIVKLSRKPGEPEPLARALFRWGLVIALGAGLLAYVLYLTAFGAPLANTRLRYVAHLIGAFGGYGLALVLARYIDRHPTRRLLGTLGLVTVLSFAFNVRHLPSSAGSAAKPNVLLITIDTCNVKHLSTYGYDLDTTPNLSRIANEGVLFENAWCHVALTGPSHASIFSGLQPQAYQVFDNAKALPLNVQTLAESFREAGYYTMGIPGNLVMLEAYNLHQGFDRYPQRSAERGFWSLQWEHTWYWRMRRVMYNDRRTTALMVHDARHQNRHFFESLPLKGARNWFCWLHYFDAHAPYTAADSDLLEAREVPERDLSYLGSIEGLFDLSYLALEPLYGNCFLKEHQVKPLVASPAEIRDLVRTYDGQLRHLDTQLGVLFDRLRESGELDNTMIVICGDHGEALYERGYFGHSYFLHDDEMRVPLIVWYGDKLQPHRVTRPVALSDIAPTLTDYAALPAMPGWAAEPQLAGQSLRPLLEGKDDPAFSTVYMARYDHSRGMVNASGQKLVFQAVMGKQANAARPWTGPQWLWFDLFNDPGETVNLAGRDLKALPESRYQQLLQLQGTLFGLSRDIDGVPTEDINFQQYLLTAVSPEEVAMLKSLGYLQGPSSSGPPSEAHCEQETQYTTDAAEYLRATGLDPAPAPLGFGTYLAPPDYPADPILAPPQ